MLDVVDYSGRRGVLVPMLDTIYAALAEAAEKDKTAGLPPLGNKHIWMQRMKIDLVDISRRFLLVTDARAVAGLMIYRFADKGPAEKPGTPVRTGQYVYIDELAVAWPYRYNPHVFSSLLDKFMNDRTVKDCVQVYAGARVKVETDKEILASVGFKDTFEGGYEPLGAPLAAAAALKLRYTRSF